MEEFNNEEYRKCFAEETGAYSVEIRTVLENVPGNKKGPIVEAMSLFYDKVREIIS